MKSLKKKIVILFVWLFLIYTLVDANNIFLGIKSYVFGATLLSLMWYSRIKLPISILRFLIIIFLLSLFSYLMGRLYGYEVDNTFFFQYFFTFSLLLLLGWHKILDFYGKIWLPCFILAIGTIVCYFVVENDPIFAEILFSFGKGGTDTPNIYISDRTFLGYEFHGLFYTPVILCILPASVYFYRLFNRPYKTKNLVLSIIFLLCLFCAGNRACLLSFVIIPSALILIRIDIKNKFLHRLLLLSCFVFTLYITLALVSEKEESSNETKNGHLNTYSSILNESPYAYITGMGPGSMVYSYGFGRKTVLMEWTYLELLRMYGLGGIIILCFYWYPIYYIWKNKKNYEEGTPMILGSSLYMLSSATNPYLLNSTGMIFYMLLYSYMVDYKVKSNPQKMKYS